MYHLLVDLINFYTAVNYGDKLYIDSNKNEVNHIGYDYVINSTYSGINLINNKSGLDEYDFKHQISEMALIIPPPAIRGVSITVMDGPFFSMMPYPPAGKNTYTLSHVNFTHHYQIRDDNELQNYYFKL